MSAESSMDKIQTIERSLRCFTLGFLGLIPVIGMPFGFLAMVHFHAVILTRAKQWNPARRYLLWGFFLGGIGLLKSILIFGLLMYAVSQGLFS